MKPFACTYNLEQKGQGSYKLDHHFDVIFAESAEDACIKLFEQAHRAHRILFIHSVDKCETARQAFDVAKRTHEARW
jgi:hypothetical protein